MVERKKNLRWLIFAFVKLNRENTVKLIEKSSCLTLVKDGRTMDVGEMREIRDHLNQNNYILRVNYYHPVLYKETYKASNF